MWRALYGVSRNPSKKGGKNQTAEQLLSYLCL
uniref:Uncharacterized protein n=1 Tax=Arundo donax TaxID=35708 RepID=A0A0A8YEI5_ARUDO